MARDKKYNNTHTNLRIFNKIRPLAKEANLSIADYIDNLVLDRELNKDNYDTYLDLKVRIKNLIIESFEIEELLIELKKSILEKKMGNY